MTPDYLGRATVDGLPFWKLRGEGEWCGWGTNRITYTVYIEEGTGVRKKAFARKVERILGDSRGWIRGGKVAFKRVEDGANTQLILAMPDTVDKLCYPLNTEGEVSCCQGTKVVINIERWKHAVPHWTGPVETYRQMVINHEFGHRTGHPHGYCPGPGKTAPVMQQQTYGLQTCRENSWPLDSEL